MPRETFMEIGKKSSCSMEWPYQKRFFTKGTQPLLLSKYGLPLVLFSALILVFITFVGKKRKKADVKQAIIVKIVKIVEILSLCPYPSFFPIVLYELTKDTTNRHGILMITLSEDNVFDLYISTINTWIRRSLLQFKIVYLTIIYQHYTITY